MKALAKFGAVLAGYVAAVLAASAAFTVRVANTSGPDAQASAGMYAIGNKMLLIAVFGAVLFFPTGLALWFFRPFHWVWVVLSITAMTIAATGLLAAALCVLERFLAIPDRTFLCLLVALAFVWKLVSPPLAAAFVVARLVAPGWRSRWALLAAGGTEGDGGWAFGLEIVCLRLAACLDVLPNRANDLPRKC
jgi:hypothetical protein